MATKIARDLARKGRKSAPSSIYDFARYMEKAILELADAIDALDDQSQRQGPPKELRRPH